MIIYYPTFGSNRFGNTLFQYLFVKYLEKILQISVYLGEPNTTGEYSPDALLFPWKLFDITNNELLPPVSDESHKEIELAFGDRRKHPREDIAIIRNCIEQFNNGFIRIDGYFQYDTSLMFADEEYALVFRENFSLNYENNNFQKTLINFRRQIEFYLSGAYLIAIHIRRGDYLNSTHRTDWVKDVFYPMNLDPIIDDLKFYLKTNKIINSVIYIATDDPQFCKDYFFEKGISIITYLDIENKLDVDNQNETLLFDMAALASAKFMIASNSSLSIISSMINEKASVFWRQTKEGKTVSFDPRSTPILYGL